MKTITWILIGWFGVTASQAADLRITSLTRQGELVVTNAFTNGVLTFDRASSPGGEWVPDKSVFSIATASHAKLDLTGRSAIFRARALDLSGAAGIWTLVGDDILDLPALVNRLNSGGADGPVSGYVTSQFSGNTQDLLFLYAGGADETLQQALVTEFNGIIQAGELYDEQRFAGVTLSSPTRALIGQAVQGEALLRLNRMLLEDAYPQELRQKRASGFTNLVHSYGILTTIAGSGNILCSACNSWQNSFEGGPATNAALSSPHIAMADRAGNIYIADKRAHAIRKLAPDGTLSTVAGTGNAGRGDTDPAPATSVDLNNPNGLWVREDGTFYILDRDNGFIRKVDTEGVMTTLVDNGSSIPGGRGLWVSPDESILFYSAGSEVKVWDTTNGLAVFASGFFQTGNLAVDPNGKLVVTDSDRHLVVRIERDGSQIVIAGNGSSIGGGDGQLATETALFQVRAIWFLPTGAFFVGTDQGSQVWYVDTDGHIHLFLNGATFDAHSGDGSWFYADPATPKVSFVKQITMDYDGNLLITESSFGYVRKIRFLPLPP